MGETALRDGAGLVQREVLPGDRVLVLLSAGNLAITQAVVSLQSERRARINADNAYFKDLRESWGERIRQAFAELPALDWESLARR